MNFSVISFYKFFEKFDLGLQEWLKKICHDFNLKGTILLAPEGINASLEGEDKNISSFTQTFLAHPLFSGIPIKKSASDGKAFRRLFVKIKKEIVTFKKPEINPVDQTGIFIKPDQWNNYIQNPDVVTIDVRNTYEYEVGHFSGAINPETRSFSQFAEFIEKNRKNLEGKKIAMYCTGGIRCEKASAYMIKAGFNEVYQLEGGILHYLETSPQKNLWEGECVVFDDRWSVNTKLEKGSAPGPF